MKNFKIRYLVYLSSLYLAQLPRGSVPLNILTIYTLSGDDSAECFSNRQILNFRLSQKHLSSEQVCGPSYLCEEHFSKVKLCVCWPYTVYILVYVKLTGATESPLLLTEIIGIHVRTNWVMINDTCITEPCFLTEIVRMYSIVKVFVDAVPIFLGEYEGRCMAKYTVRKMDLILRSIQRRPQMQFSMARKFPLNPLRRYSVMHSEMSKPAPHLA
jgi:hypothetical protein